MPILFIKYLCALLPLIVESTSFSPLFYLRPEIFSYWGNSTTITPFGAPWVLHTFAWKKYSIGSSPLTLTPLFFTVPPAPVPLQTSPWPPPVLYLPASVRCFGTWVQITSQFFLPFLFLHSPAPISVLPLISQKPIGMILVLLQFTLSFCRGIFLSFSYFCWFALYLFGNDCGHIFHSF